MTRGVKNHTIKIQFLITLAPQEHVSASIMLRVRYDPLSVLDKSDTVMRPVKDKDIQTQRNSNHAGLIVRYVLSVAVNTPTLLRSECGDYGSSRVRVDVLTRLWSDRAGWNSAVSGICNGQGKAVSPADVLYYVKNPTLAAGLRQERSPLRSEVNSELNFSPNFEGLVLGCIDADFCK